MVFGEKKKTVARSRVAAYILREVLPTSRMLSLTALAGLIF